MPEPVAVEEFTELVTAYRLECARLGIDDVTAQHVVKVWRVLFDQQARLEAKLDALTKALKAGAIGRWQ